MYFSEPCSYVVERFANLAVESAAVERQRDEDAANGQVQ